MKTQIHNNTWRIHEESGFLTITAAILKAGPLEYGADEIDTQLNAPVTVTVPDSELHNPVSLASLEGAPVVIGHVWQDTQSHKNTAVGHIKGQPRYQNGYLYADILITDTDTIGAITSQALTDISSAYSCQIVKDEIGNFLQTDINYNHVALLPTGQGRAGPTVRILNATTLKENILMTDTPSFTRLRLANGKSIRVHNEDAEALAESDKAQEEKVANGIDPAKLQEALDQLNSIKEQMTALTTEKSDLEGQVKALRDQLDAALSPEQIESAAADMVDTQEKATAISNAKGITLEGKPQGQALKKAVVSAVRLANNKPLSEEELTNDALINGMFDVYAEHANHTPVGHSVIKTQVNNQNPSAPATDYKNQLWGSTQ